MIDNWTTLLAEALLNSLWQGLALAVLGNYRDCLAVLDNRYLLRAGNTIDDFML